MFPTSLQMLLRFGRGLLMISVVAGFGLLAAPAGADDGAAPTTGTLTSQSARKAGSTSMYASQTATSTKRKRLGIFLSATDTGDGLTVGLSKANERHSWHFEMPGANLDLNAKGAGTLKTKSAKPYGTVKLKIVTKGAWKSETCQGELIYKTRKVAVKGTFVFDTKTAWGKVGKAGFVFKSGSVTRYTDNSDTCYDYCPNATSYRAGGYNVGDAANVSAYWRKGAAKADVSMGRSLELKDGATRYDSLSGVIKAPAFKRSGDAASVKLVGKGAFRGTATVTSDTGSESSVECDNGDVYKQGSWYPVAYKNGRTNFQGKMSIFGKLSVKNTSDGGNLWFNTAARPAT